MDQDWKTIVLHNPKKIQEKVSVNTPKIPVNFEEITKVKYVSKEISQLIIDGRTAKKITRKQLANQLNLKEDIIAAIETGKAVYDGNQIAKIKKHLGVK